MEFSLKNVKYAAFASEETNCFQATLYKDGKPFCKVSNDGHGGCDDYHKVKGSPDDLYGAIKSINQELAKEIIESDISHNDSGTFQLGNDLEIVVGDLMNKWHQDQEIKKILRRISYIKGNGLYQLPAKHKPTPVNIASIQTNCKWWKPEYIMVSGKPVDEARADLGTINFFGNQS